MGLFDWLKPPPPPDHATRTLIEHAVATVDPLIRQVGGYESRLAPAVAGALDYCDDLARRIPGPVEISRAAFAADPLVHALFGSADDIELMFARSQCVREHVEQLTLSSGQCCALLGMRHREKAGYGVALEGDMVRAGVPQRTLYFTDHTLAEPSPDLAAARLRLRDVLFDSLVKGFAAHVADVRAERDGLRREQAFAQAQARSAPTAQARQLDSLGAQLRATGDALQPARLVDTLVTALAEPATYLRLDPVRVSVDRGGVITGRDQAADGDTLDFTELTSRDKRRWVVMLVRIERTEARRALTRFEQANRYIVI